MLDNFFLKGKGFKSLKVFFLVLNVKTLLSISNYFYPLTSERLSFFSPPMIMISSELIAKANEFDIF